MIRGDRIRALREALGLDQAGLAKRAEVHYSYIYRLEANEVPNVSAVIMARLAKVLKTNTDYLVGETDEAGRFFPLDQPRLTVESEELAFRLDALDEKTRSVLIALFSNLVGAAERETSDARRRLLQEYDALPAEQQKILLQAAENLAREREQEAQVATTLHAQGS